VKGLFYANTNRKFNYKQVASLLEVNDAQNRKLIYTILLEMATQGIIKEISSGLFKSISERTVLQGRIETTRRGAGYVIIEDEDEDIYISSKNRNKALNGDIVNVKLFNKKSGKKEGEVTEIVENANKIIIGTIEISDKFAFLIPDNLKLDVNLFIPLSKLKGAQNGYKAVAKIVDWPNTAKNPFGEIIEVLGRTESNDAEMKAILLSNGIPIDFPEKVLNEANRINLQLSPTEISNRTDYRNILTFTIDPVDAKDFDDALSIEYLENENIRVGIHIADVGHYVTEGSELDKEAHLRGNSVYLVDRVIPMLPEHLSNGVCSLRPNEEKFTFSAIFELNSKAEIQNEWFGKTTTLSDRRFAYEDAQERIETGEGDLAKEILDLDRLAKILRKKRIGAGALEIVSSEIRFELNEDGLPVNTHKKTTKDANKLVEEFMLLTNKRVAKFVGDVTNRKNHIPNIYRVHDKPDEQKVEMFRVFLSKFDKKFTYGHPDEIAGKMNSLFEEMKDEPEFPMIQSMAIRTMAKAIYSTENIGHYGLSFRYYAHFTSPIRRYADLMVHRILLETINNKNKQHKNLKEIADHISKTERRAVNAERDSQKYFQAYYLQDKVGETFNGSIVGITDWGMYVEMTDLNCEGMVSLKSIDSDHFSYDEKSYSIVGSSTNIKFTVGDKILVKISNVSVAKKQVDLKLIEDSTN
jgi:ribonuclease R